MPKEFEKIMAEVITTGEPLTNVIVLAPRGSDDDNKVLELIIGDRQVCVAFTDPFKAMLFIVALVKKGIDMRWCDPFNMASLPIEAGVWLDPSPEALSELAVISLVGRDN